MKKLILVFCLLASSFSFGFDNSLSWHDKKQVCDDWANMAESIMKARQAGVSIREAYDVIGKLAPDDYIEPIEILVNGAYEVPVASNTNDVDWIVQEFSDGFFKVCMGNK